MKLTFFGTSSGIGQEHRRGNSYACTDESNGKSLLIDCNVGLYRSFLTQNLPLKQGKVAGIVVLSRHRGHMLGLIELLCSWSMTQRSDVLVIAGPPGIQRWIVDSCLELDTTFDFPIEYIEFPSSLPAEDPCFRFHVASWLICAFPIPHGSTPSFGIWVAERDKRPFQIPEKSEAPPQSPAVPFSPSVTMGTRTIFLGDTSGAAEEVDAFLKWLAGHATLSLQDESHSRLVDTTVDCLIHEATFSDEHKDLAMKKSHSTYKGAVELAKMIRARKLILTHFHPMYQSQGAETPGDPLIREMVAKAQELAGDEIEVIEAIDFQTITVSSSRRQPHV